jgi:CHAD domain-containing protein
MPNGLYLRYQERLKDFENTFHQIVATPTEENIHDFRVSIKKLRTILNFIKDLNPDYRRDNKDLFRQITPVFKKAGIVRELQILEQQLRNEDLELRSLLQKKIQSSIGDFETICQNFDLDYWKENNKKLLKAIRRHPNKTIEQGLFDHFKIIYSKILHQLQTQPIRYHQIRKGFKKIAELLSLWTQIDPKNPFIGYTEKIKEINTLLGNWHDWDVNISLLKSLKNDHTIEFDHLLLEFEGHKSNHEKHFEKVGIFKIIPERLLHQKQKTTSFPIMIALILSVASFLALLIFREIYSTEN